MTEDSAPRLTRRSVLTAGAGVAGLLAVGGYELSRSGTSSSATMPNSTFTGATADADITLRATKGPIDLGSRSVQTWSFDGALPGREIRLKQGERTRIRIDNDLPDDTTVHWHGIRLANPMDGVPGATQKPIAPGGSFLYDFTPPDAGTYLYHSHVGTQLDRGLYGPLIVDAKNESLSYDEDVVLMLDDWLDGIDGTPDAKLAALKKNGMSGTAGMGGMGGMGSGSGMMNSGSGMVGVGVVVGVVVGGAGRHDLRPLHDAWRDARQRVVAVGAGQRDAWRDDGRRRHPVPRIPDQRPHRQSSV